MPTIAKIFAFLLIVLGFILYFSATPDPATQERSLTAFIPSLFGAVLLTLGFIASNEKARMHAMHGAALLGLIGFAMPAFMVGKAMLGGSEFEPVKHGGQLTMAVLCAMFLGFCIKSFIDARVARKMKEAQEPKVP